MTLTLTDVPPDLDDALRRRAAVQGKTIDEVALDVLRAGLAISTSPPRLRDLSGFAGTWVADPAGDVAKRVRMSAP